ncbi:MAG: hypothetical protein ABIM98_08705 [candidate division WOR-3 bacterium]
MDTADNNYNTHSLLQETKVAFSFSDFIFIIYETFKENLWVIEKLELTEEEKKAIWFLHKKKEGKVLYYQWKMKELIEAKKILEEEKRFILFKLKHYKEKLKLEEEKTKLLDLNKDISLIDKKLFSLRSKIKELSQK